MLAIPRDIGGTIRVRAPRRATEANGADDSPTVVIFNEAGGTQIASQAATLGASNTTTTGAVSAGGTTCTLTAATNIVVGDEYLIGPNATGQLEFVKVRSIDTTGLLVTFCHATLFAYASGVSFESTYLSVAITSAQVTDSYANWRAVFSWQLLGVDQPAITVRFDVVRHWIQHQPCTLNDIRGYDPIVSSRLPGAFDWVWALDAALGDVLREVNQSIRANSVLGEDDWKDLVALKTLSEYVGNALGDKGESYRETWRREYQHAFAVLKPQLVADENEDGGVSSHEGRRGMGGELHRA